MATKGNDTRHHQVHVPTQVSPNKSVNNAPEFYTPPEAAAVPSVSPSLGTVGLDAANSRVPVYKVIARDSVDGLPCDDGSDPEDNDGGVCPEEDRLGLKLS
jgi:hypothetical protein